VDETGQGAGAPCHILKRDSISIRQFSECANVPDHDPLSYVSIQRLKHEYSRLSRLTTFERINERAADCKADRWLQYIPFTPFQLTDYDAAADDERNDSTVTLLAHTADPNPILRSTQRSARPYKQFRIIKRPTEVRAIMHAQGVFVLDEDFEVIHIESIEPLRWCILCKSRHSIDSFVRHKRYLNGLSYACKKSLQEGFRGWRWRLAG
jgi:hypothetical protein